MLSTGPDMQMWRPVCDQPQWNYILRRRSVPHTESAVPIGWLPKARFSDRGVSSRPLELTSEREMKL
jgi:hypothetical protein